MMVPPPDLMNAATKAQSHKLAERAFFVFLSVFVPLWQKNTDPESVHKSESPLMGFHYF
jgi:hypothetical protein